MKQDRGLGHGVVRERVVLAGLVRPGDERTAEPPLMELRRLAQTAGAEVVDEILQKKARVSAATFLGKGKAQEIGRRAASLGAGAVLFNNDLTPAQVRNLEKIVDRRVVDRSEVILDIFALRARSREANVQVELAQYEYLRSRLKRMWTHLERIEGGAGGATGGIGTRGPGEKQLEVDRRLVARRIRDLKGELDLLERQQRTRSRARAGYFRVSLVGYTNAGKSSLLRALTGAEAFVEDRLFPGSSRGTGRSSSPTRSGSSGTCPTTSSRPSGPPSPRPSTPTSCFTWWTPPTPTPRSSAPRSTGSSRRSEPRRSRGSSSSTRPTRSGTGSCWRSSARGTGTRSSPRP